MKDDDGLSVEKDIVDNFRSDNRNGYKPKTDRKPNRRFVVSCKVVPDVAGIVHFCCLPSFRSSCQFVKKLLYISYASSKVIELRLYVGDLRLYVSNLRLYSSELRLYASKLRLYASGLGLHHVSKLHLYVSKAAVYRSQPLVWGRNRFIDFLRFQAANEMMLLGMFP